MITVAGLILALSGPCTLYVAGTGLVILLSEIGSEYGVLFLLMALIFGGPPILLGAYLLRSGLRRARAAPRTLAVEKHHD